MKDIKIGKAQHGFVRTNSVAYMYFRSETIFFRGASGYWFHQPLERFTEAITHESIHMVLLRIFGGRKTGRRISKAFDIPFGEIYALNHPRLLSKFRRDTQA